MQIPTLENQIVRLSPLELAHVELLSPIASQDRLIAYSPSNISTFSTLEEYIKDALMQYKLQTSIPFIIFDKRKMTHAGSTRFMHIDWTNKILHIGSTWIGKEFQGTGLNTAMKELMLDYAFNTMNFEKVEFRIDELNIKSRKAVEKLGAQLEGILRENVYLLDGFKRNTCCYGLLKKEWANSYNL
tara:strand:+ start:624 stop:1181 length:558 start_codon:yes stop_codon:yes gene_type:complete